MRRNPQVIFDAVDGVLTLCDTATGEFYELNETGAFLWGACEDSSVGELIVALREAFPDQDPEILEQDCREFVTSLEKAGLFVANPAAAQAS